MAEIVANELRILDTSSLSIYETTIPDTRDHKDNENPFELPFLPLYGIGVANLTVVESQTEPDGQSTFQIDLRGQNDRSQDPRDWSDETLRERGQEMLDYVDQPRSPEKQKDVERLFEEIYQEHVRRGFIPEEEANS